MLADLFLALPFALIGIYALAGMQGRTLRLAWFVQALLTLLAWREAAGSSSSSAALVFIVPFVGGPAIATLLAVFSISRHAVRSFRQRDVRP